MPKCYVEQEPVVARLFVRALGFDATGNHVSVGTVLAVRWGGRWFEVFDPKQDNDNCAEG